MTSSSAYPDRTAEVRSLNEWLAQEQGEVRWIQPHNIAMISVAHELAHLVAEAAGASGVSRRDIWRSHEFAHAAMNLTGAMQIDQALRAFYEEPQCLRATAWDADWSGFGSRALSWEWLVAGVCGARTVGSTSVALTALVEAGTNWTLKVIDPIEAMLRSLQRMIRLGRRADVSRQLAVQRLRFACRAARSSPDMSPGEVVVASSRVPRGPDLPRVISAPFVEHSRERSHLT